MESVSRTSKSIKNATISLGFYFINLVVQFFSRRVFLEYLGSEILGLNSTATNLLQFLNLAELGVTTAVAFCLYKPLYNKDENAVNEIITLQGKIYKRIACIIILGAICIMCFFPRIFSKMELPMWYAYASFGVLLYGSLLGYFVNYKQVALSASQQEYKIHYSFKTVNIIKTIFQIVAVSYFLDGYLWWLVLEVVFASIAAYSLHRMTMRNFPGLRNVKASFRTLHSKYPVLAKKIGQLLFHKIGGFALTESSPLIIYAFANLSLVALYGNYLLITQGVSMMSRAIFNSVNAGIGNLVSEGDQKKIRSLFDELFSLRFLLVTTLCVCVYVLTPPFISRWIGKEYLLGNITLFLMVLMLYIQLFRLAAESFSYAYGLYGDIWAPIIEAILNIGLSIWGGHLYGLNGILAGAILSQIIIVVIWKPYYLFHKKMHGYGLKYIIMYFKHLMLFISVILSLYIIVNAIDFSFECPDWIHLFLLAVVTVCCYFLPMAGLMIILRFPFIEFCKRLRKF